MAVTDVDFELKIESGANLVDMEYGLETMTGFSGAIAITTDCILSNEVPSKMGTVAKLAMRQPFVLFKGLTFQKLCLPGAFRPGDHHNKMLRPGLCVVHASPQYL